MAAAAELTAEELELLDPHPDIHALFVHYNSLYFEDKLGACSVEWSSARMTLCGGVCEWRPGGGCRIKLSEPLLKLRPARDLKDVLLHEMTHAHLMLQGIRDNDPGGHGTTFRSIINRINASTVPDHQRPPGGYHITVCHSMLAEVDHYRQHHWQCQRCQRVIKRAMNRPPQEADCRGRMGRGADCRDPDCGYHAHIRTCGGAWVKIKEPEGYKDRRKKGTGSSSSGSKSGTAGGSGSAGGAPARRPDGEPPPAKRPKKGGGGLPAAAAAGTRAITDFFKQPGQEAAVAAAAGDGGSPGGDGVVLPALQAVAAAAGGAPAATGQAAPAEPTPEERRRLLAEAAMRRLGLSGEQQQQQSPPPPPQQQVEVIDLQDSQEDSPLGASLTERWQQQRQQQHGTAPERAAPPDDGGGGSGSSQPAGEGAMVECPVCGQQWAAGALSNEALNSHIDECLNVGYSG